MSGFAERGTWQAGHVVALTGEQRRELEERLRADGFSEEETAAITADDPHEYLNNVRDPELPGPG